MKRFLFYVTLVAIIALVGAAAHKRGYRFGYKAGKNHSLYIQNLSQDYIKDQILHLL